MVMVYGAAGMRDYNGVLSFRPRRPEDAKGKLRFPLTVRGHLLDVEIDADARVARYTLKEGERLAIFHEDEEIQLTQDDPMVTRPLEARF